MDGVNLDLVKVNRESKKQPPLEKPKLVIEQIRKQEEVSQVKQG